MSSGVLLLLVGCVYHKFTETDPAECDGEGGTLPSEERIRGRFGRPSWGGGDIQRPPPIILDTIREEEDGSPEEGEEER